MIIQNIHGGGGKFKPRPRDFLWVAFWVIVAALGTVVCLFPAPRLFGSSHSTSAKIQVKQPGLKYAAEQDKLKRK